MSEMVACIQWMQDGGDCQIDSSQEYPTNIFRKIDYTMS